MEISGLFIRVVFLAFPGILATKLYRKLRGRTQKKVWEDFSEILFFAVASYMILGVFNASWARIGSKSDEPRLDEIATTGSNMQAPAAFRTLQAFIDDSIPIDWAGVCWATIIGVALALVASCAHRRSWLSRGARRLKLSDRSGDEDIWDYFINMPDTVWVFVRDHKLDLIYYGYIAGFSDSGTDRELLLGDVDVYGNTEPSKRLYSVQALYVSRDRYDLTIELPGSRATDQNNRRERKQENAG